jgi:hypothetical protein
MDESDWNHAASLLHVAEKAHQWPQLHGLRDMALKELQKVHDEATKPKPKVNPFTKEAV